VTRVGQQVAALGLILLGTLIGVKPDWQAAKSNNYLSTRLKFETFVSHSVAPKVLAARLIGGRGKLQFSKM
jgi:hypothetical protein